MNRSSTLANRLDGRLIERCEEIPDAPSAGDYVVFDVLHFSNTVIELLANGAAYVHVTDERGDEPAFKRARPDAVIGGASTDDYEPAPGYDFFNSPSFVQGLDVAERPVAMTSSNGGRAVSLLRDRLGPDGAVYVGSTTNAAALGAHLRAADAPTYLVSAGSGGEVAIEDHLGAALVARHLDGHPPADAELERLRRRLAAAKGPAFADRHELRRRDLYEYAMAIDSRAVVPRLSGEGLVDVAGRTPGTSPGIHAAD